MDTNFSEEYCFHLLGQEEAVHTNILHSVIAEKTTLCIPDASIMTTNHLKTGTEPVLKMSCVSNILLTAHNAQCNNGVMNQ
jgi:hypothetical protein